MNRGEAVNWLINLSADIGKREHQSLWHYEQALSEIKDMLESSEPQQWIPCGQKLPEEETDVIICNAKGEIAISRGSKSTEVDDFIWYTSGWRFGDVIAWRELPEPYREKSNVD